MTTQTTVGDAVSSSLLDTMNGTKGKSAATGSNTLAGNSAADLQDTFMQLLVAQMKNQDPTNPMDSSQMTTQIAQISTVSGIGQLNISLASLSSQLTAGEQTQAAALKNSVVLTPGNAMAVADGKATPVGVQLASDATNVKIEVKNAAGQIVQTLDLGNLKAGTVPVAWTPVDTAGNPLPDGTYTITTSATIDGKAAVPTALTASQVLGVVQQADGRAGLVLSNGSTVGLNSVAAIL
ncbi:flagellar hook assembly protein FlgD [Paraburkholderia bonniea]|uniref:flagellar hook assembly protein FlgD n=1 Tax=Paraburkholderia bonniea TaxID=2152891 RepID=UPI001290F097|nr:flagellar hook assembly protein FlgD [Paraburkholderia bonniea]WJF90430.1 flagellar hook assembly protein FlgD [Paraburkholderia bonniea]WJF93745.1 flagellar hook assembly protein FlgD [Paraburkholderia bonniea]